MYLTYEEYQGYGGTLSEIDFTIKELKARKRIDRYTDSRVSAMETIPEAVKLCIYAIVGMEDAIGREKQALEPAVTSFNNDGYSESYGNTLNVEDAEKSISALIGEYLWGEEDDYGVPLLYRGVSSYL